MVHAKAAEEGSGYSRGGEVLTQPPSSAPPSLENRPPPPRKENGAGKGIACSQEDPLECALAGS